MTRGNNSDRDYCRIARTYADQVVAGEIAACRWVRLACERQLRDLDKQWQWRFDEERANRFCRFAELLPHVKGRWKSKTIILEPWQCFEFTTLFGWVDDVGMRRFRKAVKVIPRKNSKTTCAAIVALYLLGPDREPGAEVFSAATTKDQANISWSIAHTIVERTPGLRNRFGIAAHARSISCEPIGGFFKSLSREADSLEGLNVHGGLIDELHVHPTREIWDVLDNGISSRQQPLIYAISTEGDAHAGIFVDQVDYLQSILSGTHEDDSYWGIYYGLDKEDDWTLEESWHKANPNLGVSIAMREMRDKYAGAKQQPSAQSTFLTKRLNVRVGAASAYFNMLAWANLCCDPRLKIEDFRGVPCILTIDLASKLDLSTIIAMFRRDGHYYVFGKYYLPESALENGKANSEYYRGWQQAGILTVTSGARTDYEVIERDVLELRDQFRPERVGIDPAYNGEAFRQHMEKENVTVIEIPHTALQFSEPMKDTGSLIVAGRIHCDGDPVLTWAMSNVVAKPDAKDKVYPVKARPEKKIDPAVMLIANMSQWLRLVKPKRSVYASPETAAI